MVKEKVNNIGIEAKAPEKTCDDVKCPWHGKLPVRGRVLIGKVVSDKAVKTAVIRRDYTRYIPKYEIYERRKSRMIVYNPECVDAKKGDVVKVAECRPLSKTKAFVVIEVMKRLEK